MGIIANCSYVIDFTLCLLNIVVRIRVKMQKTMLYFKIGFALLFLTFNVYSQVTPLSSNDLRLPARSAEYSLTDVLSFDSNNDGNLEIYDKPIINTSSALQQWKIVDNNELLLHMPVFHQFNKSVRSTSIINEPFPIMGFLGRTEEGQSVYAGITLLYGDKLSNSKTLSLANTPIIPSYIYLRSFGLIDFNTIDDFNFLLTDSDKAYLIDNKLGTPLWSVNIDSPATIPKNMVKRIKFNNDDVFDIIILEDNRITVRDSVDGGIIWSAEFSARDVQVGNFDNDPAQEFIIKSNFGSLMQFDFSQHNPIWTYQTPLSFYEVLDYKVYDKNIDNLDEMVVLDSSGSVYWVNNTGIASSTVQNSNYRDSSIEIGSFGNNILPRVVTNQASFDLELTQKYDSFIRQSTTFKYFSLSDINKDGIDELYNLNKGYLTQPSTSVLESLNAVNGEILWQVELENLFYGSEIIKKVLISQMDADPNLEIIVISRQNINADFDINVYDGITFVLEKSYSVNNALLSNPQDFITADSNADGLSEFYILDKTDFSHYQLFEINNEFTNISWTSPIYEGYIVSGNLITANIDTDLSDELIIFWNGSINILDLNSKIFQLNIPHNIISLNLQQKPNGKDLIVIENNIISRIDSVTGEEVLQFVTLDDTVFYAENVFNSTYLIANRSKVYLYDSISQTVISESANLSSKQGNQAVIKSSTNDKLYYIGNDFGFWSFKLSDIVFKNDFEQVLE